jgi:pimeloyl-ACP methyl ester carboxylesterase
MVSILLLHGIPDTGRAWDPLVAELAPSFRCVAPDLPGFGTRVPPARLAGLGALRDIVDELASSEGLPDRVTLVAHDVGGLFGLAWAVARPQRLDRLVLLNTSVFPDRRWHWGARLLRTPVIGELALFCQPRPAFRAEMRRASAGNLGRAAIDEVHAAFGREARRTALAFYRMQTPELLSGLPEAVRDLTAAIPTLVLWGGRDPYLPADYADRFGAGTVKLYPDIGHWPHREAPGRIAADIRAFLQDAGPLGFRAE